MGTFGFALFEKGFNQKSHWLADLSIYIENESKKMS